VRFLRFLPRLTGKKCRVKLNSLLTLKDHNSFAENKSFCTSEYFFNVGSVFNTVKIITFTFRFVMTSLHSMLCVLGLDTIWKIGRTASAISSTCSI